MISIKTSDQIEILRSNGKLSKLILEEALEMAKPGVKPIEIDAFIDQALVKNGATPWFKEIDQYPYASCISVNEVWVHGMPNDISLKEGDLVSIDLGVKKDGLYVDHCWTKAVTSGNGLAPQIISFLDIGKESLMSAISEFKVGNRVGDISYAMQMVVESAGYSVIREYTGHGIGTGPHEEPHIKCYGTKGAGPVLKEGMVFAIEIMYAMGNADIVTLNDGWSLSTQDKSLTGMFEHTVLLTSSGPEILTK